jgi:hypothetical protein
MIFTVFSSYGNRLTSASGKSLPPRKGRLATAVPERNRMLPACAQLPLFVRRFFVRIYALFFAGLSSWPSGAALILH